MATDAVSVNPTESVSFADLERQHGPIREELREAFERVLDRSAFILGDEVEAFEDEWAGYCQAGGSVGVSSGTAALRIALQAAGIGAGDEVIVPAHTFIASALAIALAGATPVFCDVTAGTGLIDPVAARDAVTSRTAGIMCVHLYGQICDMTSLRSVADRHKLLLLEDAAQAQGATRNGRPAGAQGDVAAFSFYPSKNLGALGDAGAITSSSQELLARARMLRDLGQQAKGQHEVLAGNDRLDGLQAALLRVKLPHLDGWNRARREVAAVYRAQLDPRLKLLAIDRQGVPNYHLFPIRVTSRDDLADALAIRGVQTGVHYTPALHQQKPLAVYGDGPYPEAEAWAAEELSLPMFAELTEDEVAAVVHVCNDVLGAAG